MIEEKTINLENADEVNKKLSIFIAKNIRLKHSLDTDDFLQNVYEITLYWAFYHYQDEIMNVIKFQTFVASLVNTMSKNGLTFTQLQNKVEQWIKEQENASTID